MKMQPDRLDGVNLVSRLEPRRIWVHQTVFEGSLLIPHRGEAQPWPRQAFSDLVAEDFERMRDMRPEIVILGSGNRTRFPPPALWRSLIEAGIGFESMDTAAAARTYNVLASEGRAVLAALVLEPPA